MKELDLQEIQKNSFTVLCEVKRICEEQKLTYFLAYGTLLGAVRHNGFIPWDDDIDIMMPRTDYEKFIEYCVSHANEMKPFELLHYKTNEKYIYPISRFSDSRYKIDYDRTKDYGLGLFVDIYPLDGINPTDTRFIKKMQRGYDRIYSKTFDSFYPSSHKWRTPFKFLLYIYLKTKNQRKMLQKQDALAKKYDYSNSKYIGCIVWGSKYFYTKAWFSNVVLHSFEGQVFPIPVEFDSVLKMEYNDYMQLPKAEDRIPHHYYTAVKK